MATGAELAAYAAYTVVSVILLLMTAAAAVAARQEGKIWRAATLPSLGIYGHCKVFWFNMVWMAVCGVGLMIIVLLHILSLGQSNIEEQAHRWVERLAAKAVTGGFIGRVEVIGMDNLPDEHLCPAPVYIANHSSQIDGGVVYYFHRRFKWIAKSSVLFIPGVGGVMWLAGHVLINRAKGRNTKSKANLFDKSSAAVQSGVPMFFFPQGTRALAGRLPFKDGAFVVAETNQSPIVPISIDIPLDAWRSWYPFSLLWTKERPTIRLIIHPPIPLDQKVDRETLKKQCWERIYSVLPDHGKIA